MPPIVRKPTTLAFQLGNHSFPSAVFHDNRTVLKEAFAPGKARDIEAKPLRELTESEWHVRACGFALSHFLGLVQQLAQIPAYIQKYHRTSSLAARDVTRASDVAYHLENFVIRSQSLQDRALQLCSAVLHTGLDLRSISYTHMVRNHRVRAIGLDTQLKAINNLCQKYSQARNQVVHQHGLLDGDLRRAELFVIGSRVLPKEKRGGVLSSYRSIVGELALRKVDELDEFTRQAISASENLFTALEPQYSRSKARLAVV